jgi:hypothetical protein
MIDDPHILGFSPVARRINLASALASARPAGSLRATINSVTLNLVGLVFSRPFQSPPDLPETLTWIEEPEQPSARVRGESQATQAFRADFICPVTGGGPNGSMQDSARRIAHALNFRSLSYFSICECRST